ncbi:helix-turn-helix domain-containing protein [Terribacillus sp. DMT04]|uniref:helix-turn-helix domain-containing protein n=1 Tax=Terribacillus sp. DMT04 TaxID=2850441 RepID=UPI001C2C6E71|nr:helix-turn-helix domain-containing protein [Terribacillus sp. DMT04]QXE02810.1 helix-turn-helix domain-containing protein [Terribacillus sp. DMT04]
MNGNDPFEKYPEVLDPKHVKEILDIGLKQTYELLNQEPKPFHFIKIGRRFKIPKQNFIAWLQGSSS